MGVFGNSYINEEDSDNLIGTIDLEESLLEDIGTFKVKSKGTCNVELFPDDNGTIPHFHIRANNPNDFDCCIEILEARYFSHGHHNDVLTNSDEEKLNKWLKEKPTKGKDKNEYKTRWEQIKGRWNNGEIRDKDIEQPNYDRIKLYKEK